MQLSILLLEWSTYFISIKNMNQTVLIEVSDAMAAI